ncbi:putative peptide modification system cyclase, partial [Xanthomonas sp. Kuri4-3]
GERGERLLWKSHGRWRFKGVPTPMEIYEVGEIGLTPLRAPRHSPKAWRDIPLWRRPAALVAELAVLAVLGVGIWFITRAQPAIAFAERDWVVVGDLRNLTGNRLLDGSIDQAFRISLEQSRYVNVVSQMQASSILAMMRKKPEEDALDRDNAASVATRLGARMVLLPSVADLGGRSRFSVEVVDPRTQRTVAISSAYATNASLLGAVDKVTADLRDRLGEDANSIRGTSQPLPEVTTSSLDALRAYSLGQTRYAKGDYRAAVAFYQQAVEVDEQFALAWLGQARGYFASVDLQRATERLEKALSLSARLPAREALYLKNWRTQILDPSHASQAWTQMAELYPDYAPASHNAALNLYNENRFDEALPYARAVAQSQVDLSSVGLDQYARILLAMGQFKAADNALQRAVELGWNGALLRQATVAAAEKDFVRARELMAAVHEDDYHADNMRVSIALDEGDIAYATTRAATGMARSHLQVGVDRLNYYMPLALSHMLAGRTSQAMAIVSRGAQLAVTGLDEDPPVDAIDKAATGLALAILAQRMGDESISRQVLSRLALATKMPRGRVLDELTAVVVAEQQRLAGDPERSLETLSPYLDRLSRVQTRVAALKARARLAICNWRRCRRNG